jgi:hypothetical protein
MVGKESTLPKQHTGTTKYIFFPELHKNYTGTGMVGFRYRYNNVVYWYLYETIFTGT